MKKFSFIIAAFAMICLASCGPKRSQAYYDAPSQLLSANYDGTFVFRTQIRARNAAIAFTDAQRKVMKEVIFDGVKAANSGVEDLKPLCFDLNKTMDRGRNTPACKTSEPARPVTNVTDAR